MIIPITRYTARLALRIPTLREPWQSIELIIKSVPDIRGFGSPWYLTGCWPFHPTNVDLANPPRPDFPPIIIKAFDRDEEGRIVFLLDDRVHNLPNGRYEGLLRVVPNDTPINFMQDRQGIYELFSFDIDLGPENAQHMVDQAVVEMTNEFSR